VTVPARPLDFEERALWARVIETVNPLHPRPPSESLPVETRPPVASAPRVRPPPSTRPVAPTPKPRPGSTLDGSWDRRLGKGLVSPDMSVDLHGHNLAGAYALLDERLERAIASGARLLLLITGKPPRGEPPVARGRIRAAVGDWIAASRHAGSIAAVRNAHPRHGGTGALYIVLRRRK